MGVTKLLEHNVSSLYVASTGRFAWVVLSRPQSVSGVKRVISKYNTYIIYHEPRMRTNPEYIIHTDALHYISPSEFNSSWDRIFLVGELNVYSFE